MPEIQSNPIALLSLIARVPIQHDGQDYVPGDRISVTKAQAKPLIDGGCAELATTDGAAEGESGDSTATITQSAASSRKR